MGIPLQVRDVPEDVHRILKARAAEAGVSLSEFVRQELARVATRSPKRSSRAGCARGHRWISAG